jgi:5'-methylthioinosine phosphorylase
MKSKCKTIAFIAGSGLAQGLENILYDVKEHAHVKNKWGEASYHLTGGHGDNTIIVMARHGDNAHPPERMPPELASQRGYEANVWRLAELGAEAVYGHTAVGSIDLDIPLADEGVFIVPHDYIRGLAMTQHSFGTDGVQTWFPNMSKPFDLELRSRAIKAIRRSGYTALDGGIYICNGGAQFETPAEIRLLDRMTAPEQGWIATTLSPFVEKSALARHIYTRAKGRNNRIVGMTTIPEVALLAQMGIPFAAICSNVNYAEGLSERTQVSHEQTLHVMDTAARYLAKVAENIVRSYD